MADAKSYPKADLSADKKKLRISINADLGTEEVETLISDLAELRANMDPPVPMEPPKPSDQRVSMQDEPSVVAVPLKDGRIRFWLRKWLSERQMGYIISGGTSTKLPPFRDSR